MLNTHLKSTYEAAHAWVNKSQPEGYAQGVHFKGAEFYSGDTVVAKLINNAVVFSSTSFGMTATKHRLDVEAASRNFKQVFVPFCELSLEENVIEVQALIQALLLKASTATVKKAQYTEEAKEIAFKMNEYAALVGSTAPAISMGQFENIDYEALKQEARTLQMANLAKAKKRAARSGKKTTFRMLDASPSEKPVAHTERSLTKGDGLTISNAFGLLDGLHNMAGAGISIKDNIHVNIELPAMIAPNGDITVGGQAISYSGLQQIRGILGWK